MAEIDKAGQRIGLEPGLDSRIRTFELQPDGTQKEVATVAAKPA